MLRRAFTAVVLAALLSGPAAAWAQDPGSDPPLSDDPPTTLEGDDPAATPTPAPSPGPEPPDDDERDERLADTGSEPAYIALCGLALVLAGCGVRLRLGPHDHLLG